jgi:hypothetical protein
MVIGARNLRRTEHGAAAKPGIGAADVSAIRLSRFRNATLIMKKHDCTDSPMPGVSDSGSRDYACSDRILSMTENAHQHLH